MRRMKLHSVSTRLLHTHSRIYKGFRHCTDLSDSHLTRMTVLFKLPCGHISQILSINCTRACMAQLHNKLRAVGMHCLRRPAKSFYAAVIINIYLLFVCTSPGSDAAMSCNYKTDTVLRQGLIH